MAWVGVNIQTDYGVESSGAYPKDLVSVFKMVGINCVHEKYNSQKVKENLTNRNPVILSANRTLVPIKFLWITWGYYSKDGHTFVADGYETRQTKYTYHYRWVYDDGLAMFSKQQKAKANDFKTEEYITSTNLLMINWGWDGSFDNGRYYFDGDWKVGNDRNYTYDRDMVVGFSKK